MGLIKRFNIIAPDDIEIGERAIIGAGALSINRFLTTPMQWGCQ